MVNGAQADGDPDLLDDSEFYQQLLKEFFENIDPMSSGTHIMPCLYFIIIFPVSSSLIMCTF